MANRLVGTYRQHDSIYCAGLFWLKIFAVFGDLVPFTI